MSADSSTRNAGRALAALQPREGARRAGVEDGDPHVGGNLVETIAQRPVRIAIVAEQQPLLVGVPGVVEQHLGPAAAGRGAPRVDDALLKRSSASTSSRSRGCLRTISLAGADAAELDQHPGEALGVGDGVLQLRPFRAARVRADDQREPLQGHVRRGRGAASATSPRARNTRDARPDATTSSTVSSRSDLFLDRERGLRELARDRQRRGRRARIAAGRATRRLDDRRHVEGRVAGHEDRTAPSRARRRARRPGRAALCRRGRAAPHARPLDGRCSVTAPRPSIDRMTP